jgi:hypothetical protein
MRPTEIRLASAPPKDRERIAADDNRALFEDLLQSAATTVEDTVTGAMLRGLPVGELAAVVERRFNGQVICGCARRQGLVRIFPRYGQPADRAMLAAELQAATADELLVVLIIHKGEGVVLIGVRRVKGRFVAVV